MEETNFLLVNNNCDAKHNPLGDIFFLQSEAELPEVLNILGKKAVYNLFEINLNFLYQRKSHKIIFFKVFWAKKWP